MPTVDEIAQAGIAQLQALVDAAEASSAPLRTRRDALMARIKDLQQQLEDLNAQIVAAEGVEAVTARNAIVNIKQLQDNPTRPLVPLGTFMKPRLP